MKSFWRLALFAVLLQLAVSTLLGSVFVTQATSYWDNRSIFSLFRDVLHAANYYGELPWWHPLVQAGFPFYYLWMLAVNGTTPLYSLIVAVAWVLGQFGIVITQYRELYAVYFVYVVPVLFILSACYLLSRVFSRAAVLIYGIVLLSVSPGVVFNLSDIGLLEQTAYGLFVAGALLEYRASPSRRTFATLAVALVFVSISLNHLALYWNIVFLPIFVAVVLLVRPPSQPNRPGWAVAALPLCLLGAAPALTAYLDGGDLLRSTIGQRVYDFSQLKAGNPLEPLLSAVPDAGFAWVHGIWRPVAIGHSTSNVGYVYLGITTVPLAIVGLLAGREPWRTRFLILLGFVALVLPFSGFSPFFAPVLSLPTPLDAVNHYSDVAFRSGGFIVWIMTACLGLEALMVRGTRTLLATALVLLGANLAVSAAVFLAVHPAEGAASPIFGFVAVASVFIVIVLWLWLSNGTDAPATRWIVLFLALIFLDVATVGYWHVRHAIWPDLKPMVEGPVDQLWFEKDTQVAETLLTLRSWAELQHAGLTYKDYESVILYPKASVGSLEDGIATLRRSIPPTVVVDGITARDSALLRFWGADKVEEPLNGQVSVVRQTYNSTNFRVTVDRPAVLFWRDQYFAGWSVRVASEEKDVLRAFHAFKGVVVPAGTSTVEFVFLPRRARLALMFAYALQLLVGGAAVYCWLKPNSRSPPWASKRRDTAATN